MRVIRTAALALASALLPAILTAQDTTAVRRRDTTAHRPDTTVRKTARLNQVTITTTPVERSEPLTVTTVTPQQIALTPATSPYELLQQTAGVEMHDQGQGPGFASDLSIRGFSSDHSTDVALWIDGVPVNEPVNGHAEGYDDFTLIFPQIVTGIDVIHGPTSALYGNFAFGGAVNVRTLDRFDGYRIQMTGGSFGNGGGSAIVGFDDPHTGGVLAIQGEREDGWRTHSSDQYGHLHARIEHDLSANTSIDAGIEAYMTSYNSPGFLDSSRYNAKQYNFVSNFGDDGWKRRVQERVSLRTFLRPDLEWRTTLYSTQETWEFWLSTPPGLGGLTEGTGAETREYNGRIGGGGTTALTYAARGVDITLGAETRYDWSHYENFAEASTGRHLDSAALILAEPARQTSGGIYLQTGFDVTKYARIDLGARVDQLSSVVRQPVTDTVTGNLIQSQLFDTQHSKGVFSPKTGLLIRPFVDLGHPNIGIFVNTSRGFRQTDGIISDPTLPFIFVWDYETGLRIDEGPISLDAALFRMDVSNEQSFDPALNKTIGGGESRRNGLDFDVIGRIARGVQLTIDGTILHAFYTHYIDPDDGINYTFYPIFNTSKWVGTAALDLNLPKQIWEARIGTTLNGPYTPWEEEGVLRPGYALLNAEAGLRVYHDTHLLFGARNILDTRYRELESGGQVTPGQSVTFYATVRYDGLW